MSKTLSTSEHLNNYLVSLRIEPETPIYKKYVTSFTKNRQVVMKGEHVNVQGFLRSKILLDETIREIDFGHPDILSVLQKGVIYWYLVEKLYISLQHDMDIKLLPTIRKEGYYLEAIEYWTGKAINKAKDLGWIPKLTFLKKIKMYYRKIIAIFIKKRTTIVEEINV